MAFSERQAGRMATEFPLRTAPPWKAKTRPGAFWRSVLIGLVSGGALWINPWLSCALVIVLCTATLRPSTSILALLSFAAVLPQGSLSLFGQQLEGLPIGQALIAVAFVQACFLLAIGHWKLGRSISIAFFFSLPAIVLTVLTTSDVQTTLLGLAQFLVPIFVLLAWLDSLFRPATYAYEGAYSVAGVLFALAIGSIIAAILGVGYDYNQVDLNGVVWQPQILGLCMAPLALFMLNLRRLPLWLQVIGTIGAVALLWESWSRTGLVAIFVVAALELIRRAAARIASFLEQQSPSRRSSFYQLKKHFLALIFVSSVGFSLWFASHTSSISVEPGAEKQIFSLEGYATSRSSPLARSFANIEANLATGIGFGVPSDPRLIDPAVAAENQHALKSEGRFIILSDKGNSFVAIVEETGILGAPIWLGLFFWVLARVSATGPIGRSMAILFILSAMGEATAYAMSGIGLLQWTALIAAAGFSRQPRRRHSKPIPAEYDYRTLALNRRAGDAS
jgi:hypothetical protein